MPEQPLLPERVVSGGQTGADRAGLVAARRFGIPTGGWMPRGFLTSTGPAPELAREFGLREHRGGYADRTEANVRLADGTLRFAASFETLGEKCTLKWLRHHGKPYLDIDRAAPPPVEEVAGWIRRHNVKVLNVAGNVEPRSKKAKTSGITGFVVDYLNRVFLALGHRPRPTPGEKATEPGECPADHVRTCLSSQTTAGRRPSTGRPVRGGGRTAT